MILVSYHCLYINEQLSIRVWMGIFYGFLDHVSRVLNKYTQNCSWNKYSLNIPNETCQIIYSCNCPCGITMRPWVMWYILLACHSFVYQLQCSKFSAYTFIIYISVCTYYWYRYIYYSTISLSIQYGDKISITHVKGMLMFYGIQIKVVACQETLGLAITFNASQCLNVIYVVVE